MTQRADCHSFEPWRGPDVEGLTRDELVELRSIARHPEPQDLDALAYSVLVLLRHIEGER